MILLEKIISFETLYVNTASLFTQCDLTDLTRLALRFNNSTPLQARRNFRLYIVLLEKNMVALYYVELEEGKSDKFTLV